MKDADKTKDQLINDLEGLRQQIAELRHYASIVETTRNPVGLVDRNYDYKTQRAFLAQFTCGGKKLHHRRIWAADGIDVSPFFFELDMAAASPWFAQQIRMCR